MRVSNAAGRECIVEEVEEERMRGLAVRTVVEVALGNYRPAGRSRIRRAGGRKMVGEEVRARGLVAVGVWMGSLPVIVVDGASVEGSS